MTLDPLNCRRSARQHIEQAYRELSLAIIELSEAGDHASSALLRSARDVTDAIARQTVAYDAPDERS